MSEMSGMVGYPVCAGEVETWCGNDGLGVRKKQTEPREAGT